MSRKTRSRMMCPECGSADVVPIVYGLPAAELFASADRGEVVLGGCVVSGDGDDPTNACKACGTQFNAGGGRAPGAIANKLRL